MSELDEYWRNNKGETSIHPGKSFPVAPNDLPGYRNLKEIGSGGQGRVYRAISIADGQKVAIKFYTGKLDNGEPDDNCKNVRLVRRFRAESDILRKLDHPQLPRCFGIGDYHGRPYYVMEHLDPFSVRDLVVFDDGENDDEPLAEFLLELLDVVEYLHKHGIIHQDIKPKNICLKNGKPALIDLGLVYDKHFATYTTKERLDILARSSGGSPGFCAPEQYCGLQKDITELADIFAIGNLINECMRGFHLPQLMLIADRCLNINPANRYKSIAALRLAILNRHRMATEDIAFWGIAETNRQRRIAESNGLVKHLAFADFVRESQEYYDQVLTNHAFELHHVECRHGTNPVWWPLIVEGGRVVIEEPMRFDTPTILHVMGMGTLAMSFSGSSNVVVVLDRTAEFVNLSTGIDANETYFLNEGCCLSLPNVKNRRQWAKRHKVFRSVHNRPAVLFGNSNRGQYVDDAIAEWERFVSSHRVLAKALNNVCSCLVDYGLPVLDLSLAGFRKKR